MLLRCLSVLMVVCALGADLSALITPVTDLCAFEQAVADFGPDDLVLLDVDNVLLVPDDAILRPSGKSYLKNFMAEQHESWEKSFLDDRWGYVLQEMTVSLVDERMPSIIRQLQQQDIPMIALTACWSGQIGPITRAVDWRIVQLRKLGFDFSQAFAHFGEWECPNKTLPGHPVVFNEGVLFSPRQSKGETLKQFLHALGWKPKRIVFMDDREDFLQSVESAAKDLDIPFQGFHYTAAMQLPCEFDVRIAEKQLRHLVEHREWLSDEELKSRAA